MTGSLPARCAASPVVTYPVTPRSYTRCMAQEDHQHTENDWVGFPGGELEGERPTTLCPACRDGQARAARAKESQPTNSPAAGHAAVRRPLCFQCYRAELDRNRALRAAGQLNTASEQRFQAQLPLEDVDKPRLQMLKAERSQARILGGSGPGGFADRRRRAQIAARHAVQASICPSDARQDAASRLPDRARAIAAAIHAAELQLPESWLPFVVSR